MNIKSFGIVPPFRRDQISQIKALLEFRVNLCFMGSQQPPSEACLGPPRFETIVIGKP
jgi:hypothetical protein